MSNKAMLIMLICSFSLLQIECKKDPPVTPPIEPPPYQQSIFLSIADSGLTEVYLLLSMTDTLPPRGFEIFRNNSKILTGSLFGNETTLVDVTAQMNTAYTYQAFRVDNTLMKDSSAVVATKTLDTTSHSINWTVYTLGGASSSFLYDILLNNENDIWVFGQIFDYDSLGQVDSKPYNAAHWNGITWNLKRLYYQYNSTDSVIFSPIRGFARDSQGDMWFSAVSIFHLRQTSSLAELVFSRQMLPNQLATIEKIYIDSKDRIIGVGNAGSIVVGENSKWKVIASGTTQPFTDIYGTYRKHENNDEILCIASNKLNYSGKKLLRIEGENVEDVSLDGIPGSIISVWFIQGVRYYAVGNGVYTTKSKDITWTKETSFPSFYTNSIRGTGLNNIFTAGDFGALSHFNGLTWMHYDPLGSGSLRKIAVNNSLIVAVGGGLPNGKAIIVFGRHNQ
jgi:hypothetical protein